MPLYELFCVAASSAESAPIRDLVRTTSSLILEHGGAVRGVQYWGRRVLPQRTRRHQVWHSQGDHFFLQFDTNPRVLGTLSSRLRADPRVIKWTTLKLGDRLDQISPDPARARPTGYASDAGQMGGNNTMRFRSDE
ncbi:Mitochondrial ribosomal protein MRP17 [Ceraceosorus bombacis]|uniref:Mitochondrial ribosomal protein MRP17 n=1 Tax=Ceraceosorus bombacis TaxID=401625 RepID=A0A0N7LBH5_9BASI|nr:Mitochondrial ribosomal protein MRP17 [Ceraceosorus bombacis]